MLLIKFYNPSIKFDNSFFKSFKNNKNIYYDINVCVCVYVLYNIYIIYMYCTYIFLQIRILHKNIIIFSIVVEWFGEIHKIVFNLLWLLLIFFSSVFLILSDLFDEIIFPSSILNTSDESFNIFSVLYCSVWKLVNVVFNTSSFREYFVPYDVYQNTKYKIINKYIFN